MFQPRSAILCAVVAIYCSASDVNAQGLIFSIPEDGSGIEYAGTVSYETIRADIAEGKETITKARELSIKSVGVEDADFEGVTQPCRWIEIKVTTGTKGEAGIDPGPVGSRIYKFLVPESKLIGKATDADSIPNIVLPIVKGYRRSGEAAVRPMKSRAIAIYPTICQLTHYPEPEVVAETESPQTRLGESSGRSFNAKHLKGRKVMERPSSRSTNEGNFWVSDEAPFGLVRWEVTVTQEKKESTATRDTFQEVSTTTCEMSVSKIEANAESELVIPNNQ